MIPYSRHSVGEDDLSAVTEVLRSDYLTTGPKVEEFEERFTEFVRSDFAVAVSSGTAALHTAIASLGIGAGDEVLVPTMTFAATANVVVHAGATPVFIDVDPKTLLVDPGNVSSRITKRTRLIIAVDFAGQPSPYTELLDLSARAGLPLLADSCHALGCSYHGRAIGSIANATAFSFHPVKPATTGEGGMITTNDPKLASKMRKFRNHGLSLDHRSRQNLQTWEYDVESIGLNYRLTDFQCALGISQLAKARKWRERRASIASRYIEGLADLEWLRPLSVKKDVVHSYHLFVVKIDFDVLGMSRHQLFRSMADRGIRINVHYRPVHLLTFYRRNLKTGPGQCPNAEAAYGQIISLPVYSEMSDREVSYVIETLRAFDRTRTIGRAG